MVAVVMIAGSGLHAPWRVSAESQYTSFRSAIDLVTLHVTVTDTDGKYLDDLTEHEFVVFENGHRQRVSVFEEPGLPLAAAVVIDASVSVRSVFAEVQDTALSFVRQLRPDDVAAVMSFGDVVRVKQTFTGDRAALETAVRRTKAAGGTALYDALYIALRQLNRPDIDQGDVPRRRVMIVLSDGDDTSSLVSFEDVLTVAARGDVTVYAVRVGHTDSAIDSLRSADVELRRLARQTGGRALVSMTARELGRAFEELRTELGSQYALGYVPTEPLTDGRFRRLTVGITRPGARATTRLGYIAAR